MSVLENDLNESETRLSLTNLLEDVVIEILSHLEIRDVLATERTCKRLKNIVDLHSVWYNAIQSRILSNGLQLPIPYGMSINRLPSRTLKAAACFSARLDHNWRSAEPSPCGLHEFTPEIPSAFVNIAFLLPGTGGRFMLTVTKGNIVTFWEVGPRLRRCKRVGGWQNEGTILDLVPNSDAKSKATIAVSHIATGGLLNVTNVVTLYNIIFDIDPEGHVTVDAVPIFKTPFPGRLKLLRGNLLAFYQRLLSKAHLLNYESGFTATFDTVDYAKISKTCLAIEVLNDCVIIVQPGSVDIFELPTSLTRLTPSPELLERDDDPFEPVEGQLIVSHLRPNEHEWYSAAIIPYAAPYPALSGSCFNGEQSKQISILIRARIGSSPVVNHYHVERPHPLHRSKFKPEIDLHFTPIQTRTAVRQHFCHDIVASPLSGRGLWLENATKPGMSRSSETLMLFSTSDERPPSSLSGDVDWTFPSVDIGGYVHTTSSSGRIRTAEFDEGQVRWCARHHAEAVRGASYISFDDAVGRIVVATQDGRVRILELASF